MNQNDNDSSGSINLSNNQIQNAENIYQQSQAINDEQQKQDDQIDSPLFHSKEEVANKNIDDQTFEILKSQKSKILTQKLENSEQQKSTDKQITFQESSMNIDNNNDDKNNNNPMQIQANGLQNLIYNDQQTNQINQTQTQQSQYQLQQSSQNALIVQQTSKKQQAYLDAHLYDYRLNFDMVTGQHKSRDEFHQDIRIQHLLNAFRDENELKAKQIASLQLQRQQLLQFHAQETEQIGVSYPPQHAKNQVFEFRSTANIFLPLEQKVESFQVLLSGLKEALKEVLDKVQEERMQHKTLCLIEKKTQHFILFIQQKVYNFEKQNAVLNVQEQQVKTNIQEVGKEKGKLKRHIHGMNQYIGERSNSQKGAMDQKKHKEQTSQIALQTQLLEYSRIRQAIDKAIFHNKKGQQMIKKLLAQQDILLMPKKQRIFEFLEYLNRLLKVFIYGDPASFEINNVMNLKTELKQVPIRINYFENTQSDIMGRQQTQTSIEQQEERGVANFNVIVHHRKTQKFKTRVFSPKAIQSETDDFDFEDDGIGNGEGQAENREISVEEKKIIQKHQLTRKKTMIEGIVNQVSVFEKDFSIDKLTNVILAKLKELNNENDFLSTRIDTLQQTKHFLCLDNDQTSQLLRKLHSNFTPQDKQNTFLREFHYGIPSSQERYIEKFPLNDLEIKLNNLCKPFSQVTDDIMLKQTFAYQILLFFIEQLFKLSNLANRVNKYHKNNNLHNLITHSFELCRNEKVGYPFEYQEETLNEEHMHVKEMLKLHKITSKLKSVKQGGDAVLTDGTSNVNHALASHLRQEILQIGQSFKVHCMSELTPKFQQIANLCHSVFKLTQNNRASEFISKIIQENLIINQFVSIEQLAKILHDSNRSLKEIDANLDDPYVIELHIGRSFMQHFAVLQDTSYSNFHNSFQRIINGFNDLYKQINANLKELKLESPSSQKQLMNALKREQILQHQQNHLNGNEQLMGDIYASPPYMRYDIEMMGRSGKAKKKAQEGEANQSLNAAELNLSELSQSSDRENDKSELQNYAMKKRILVLEQRFGFGETNNVLMEADQDAGVTEASMQAWRKKIKFQHRLQINENLKDQDMKNIQKRLLYKQQQQQKEVIDNLAYGGKVNKKFQQFVEADPETNNMEKCIHLQKQYTKMMSPLIKVHNMRKAQIQGLISKVNEQFQTNSTSRSPPKINLSQSQTQQINKFQRIGLQNLSPKSKTLGQKAASNSPRVNSKNLFPTAKQSLLKQFTPEHSKTQKALLAGLTPRSRAMLRAAQEMQGYHFSSEEEELQLDDELDNKFSKQQNVALFQAQEQQKLQQKSLHANQQVRHYVPMLLHSHVQTSTIDKAANIVSKRNQLMANIGNGISTGFVTEVELNHQFQNQDRQQERDKKSNTNINPMQQMTVQGFHNEFQQTVTRESNVEEKFRNAKFDKRARSTEKNKQDVTAAFYCPPIKSKKSKRHRVNNLFTAARSLSPYSKEQSIQFYMKAKQINEENIKRLDVEKMTRKKKANKKMLKKNQLILEKQQQQDEAPNLFLKTFHNTNLDPIQA